MNFMYINIAMKLFDMLTGIILNNFEIFQILKFRQ